MLFQRDHFYTHSLTPSKSARSKFALYISHIVSLQVGYIYLYTCYIYMSSKFVLFLLIPLIFLELFGELSVLSIMCACQLNLTLDIKYILLTCISDWSWLNLKFVDQSNLVSDFFNFIYLKSSFENYWLK